MKNRGGKFFYFFAILFLTAGFFILPKMNVKASTPEVIINELMWAGSDEWIELKNISKKNVDISEWVIVAGGRSNKNLVIPKNEKYIIEPNKFFLIPDDLEDKDKEKIKLSLVDDGKRIALKDNKGEDVDEIMSKDVASFEWPAGSKNPKLSMERNDDLSGWHSYYKTSDDDSNVGTPGKENSKKPEPKEYSKNVRINEILPNPLGEEKEFIEIYNPQKEELNELKIKDKSGKECRIPKEISKNEFIVLWNCGIKLNDTTEENLTLYNPTNLNTISFVSYKKSGGENISYSFNGNKWQWSQFLTPGKENKFDEKPGVKIVKVMPNPKGRDTKSESIILKNDSKKKVNLKGWSVATGWKNLYNHPIKKDFIIQPGKTKKLTKKVSAFTLNNKKAKIELRYPDGTIASKVKYSKKEGIQDDEVYEKKNSDWEWEEVNTASENNSKSTEASINIAVQKEIPENNEKMKITESENQEQEGKVLGAISENEHYMSDNIAISHTFKNDESKPKKLLYSLFWITNRFITGAINLFFS